MSHDIADNSLDVNWFIDFVHLKWGKDIWFVHRNILVFHISVVCCADYDFANLLKIGEMEFWFASIKILTIVGVVILGIVLDLGGVTGDRIGFRYWLNPGKVTSIWIFVIFKTTDPYRTHKGPFVQVCMPKN